MLIEPVLRRAELILWIDAVEVREYTIQLAQIVHGDSRGQSTLKNLIEHGLIARARRMIIVELGID